MKKVEITIPLRDREPKTVSGYEFILETGHVAVVHKTLNGVGWSVSTKEFGLLITMMKPTMKEAIEKSQELVKQMGKGKVDNLLNHYRKQKQSA